MTKERRKSVVILVEPSFQFLLATSEAFAVGPEAREKLFSEKFLGAMLKEATQDVTLAQKDAAVRSAGRALSSHRPAGRRRVVREPASFQQPYQRQENLQAAMAVDEVGSEEREERAIAGHASVKGMKKC